MLTCVECWLLYYTHYMNFQHWKITMTLWREYLIFPNLLFSNCRWRMWDIKGLAHFTRKVQLKFTSEPKKPGFRVLDFNLSTLLSKYAKVENPKFVYCLSTPLRLKITKVPAIIKSYYISHLPCPFSWHKYSLVKFTCPLK